MQILAPPTFTATFPLARLSGGATTKKREAPPPCFAHHHEITQPLLSKKVEILKSLEPWASKNIIPFLKPVEKCWQPNEFLPDSTRPAGDFADEVRALRERCDGLPDEYFVVLVGDMITEEALPTYQSSLNRLAGLRDETGVSPSPWATWIRAWSAEENRHGDLLKTYLYLSGRVDMFMIERTIQYLIGAGQDMSTWDQNPYLGLVYTSFQERATFIAHGNTAKLAKDGGDPVLARICGTIAADEKRHENAYIKIVEKLLEIDTSEVILATGKILRGKLSMPGQLMSDGRDPHLFRHFTDVADRIGVFTIDHYVDMLEALIGRWRLDKVEGLNADARCQQDFLCSLPRRIQRFRESTDQTPQDDSLEALKFSWIIHK